MIIDAQAPDLKQNLELPTGPYTTWTTEQWQAFERLTSPEVPAERSEVDPIDPADRDYWAALTAWEPTAAELAEQEGFERKVALRDFLEAVDDRYGDPGWHEAEIAEAVGGWAEEGGIDRWPRARNRRPRPRPHSSMVRGTGLSTTRRSTGRLGCGPSASTNSASPPNGS